MKKIIIVLLSIVIIVANAQDYKELIKNVPGADKYPDASAINVFTKIDIDLSADGSFKKHVYYIKKILTYKGKRRYSDVKLDYNANIESIELGECFSIRDGEKIAIPKEAIHDNGTFMTMYSPEYINERQKVVNFPAIEPNDFIVVEYTITKNTKDFFSGEEQMQEGNPYLRKEFTITAPKSVKLNYKYREDKIKFSKYNKGEKIVYSWSVTKMPLIKDEKNNPSYSAIGCPIFYSTKASWEEASKIYFEQFNSVNYNIKEVAELVKVYANSKMTNELKLQSIYAYIQNNFEFKYSYSEDGLAPQEPLKVLEQKFGSPKELTALFLAMAKAANVKVKQVLLLWNTDFPEVKQVPCSKYHSGVFAYYNGKVIGFRSHYMPFGTSWNSKCYLVQKDNPKEILDYKMDMSDLVNNTVNVKLNKDFTADVSFKKVLKGLEDYKLRNRFKNQTEKKRKIWFTSNISDKSINVIGEPEFKNIENYNNNLEISFNAKINNYYNNQENYLYFKLPESESVELELTGAERENPYQVRQTYSIVEKYVFENIPEGYKVIKPKTPILNTYNDDKVKMTFKISSKTEGDKVIVFREISIPQTIISKENYPRFAKFIGEIQKPLNNMIFLSK